MEGQIKVLKDKIESATPKPWDFEARYAFVRDHELVVCRGTARNDADLLRVVNLRHATIERLEPSTTMIVRHTNSNSVLLTLKVLSKELSDQWYQALLLRDGGGPVAPAAAPPATTYVAASPAPVQTPPNIPPSRAYTQPLVTPPVDRGRYRLREEEPVAPAAPAGEEGGSLVGLLLLGAVSLGLLFLVYRTLFGGSSEPEAYNSKIHVDPNLLRRSSAVYVQVHEEPESAGVGAFGTLMGFVFLLAAGTSILSAFLAYRAEPTLEAVELTLQAGDELGFTLDLQTGQVQSAQRGPQEVGDTIAVVDDFVAEEHVRDTQTPVPWDLVWSLLHTAPRPLRVVFTRLTNDARRDWLVMMRNTGLSAFAVLFLFGGWIFPSPEPATAKPAPKGFVKIPSPDHFGVEPPLHAQGSSFSTLIWWFGLIFTAVCVVVGTCALGLSGGGGAAPAAPAETTQALARGEDSAPHEPASVVEAETPAPAQEISMTPMTTPSVTKRYEHSVVSPASTTYTPSPAPNSFMGHTLRPTPWSAQSTPAPSPAANTYSYVPSPAMSTTTPSTSSTYLPTSIKYEPRSSTYTPTATYARQQQPEAETPAHVASPDVAAGRKIVDENVPQPETTPVATTTTTTTAESPSEARYRRMLAEGYSEKVARMAVALDEADRKLPAVGYEKYAGLLSEGVDAKQVADVMRSDGVEPPANWLRAIMKD